MQRRCHNLLSLFLLVFSHLAWADMGSDLLQNRLEGMRFYYGGDALKQNWQRLHHQDSIPYPSAEGLKALLQPYSGTEREQSTLPANFDGDYDKLAEQVANAWRLYHAGQYRDAYKLASTLGLAGTLPKLRSLAIHHHFFLDNQDARRDAFAGLIKELEQLQKDFDLEDPALYLLKAFAIGRYGQEINPVKAFAKGLGGKLKRNIYRAAELAPDNTEALMFKAVFDAEVVTHAGKITGKILYGSSRRRAFEYFEEAIDKAPGNTALLLEYGKACLNLCEDKQQEQALRALTEVAHAEPADLTDAKNIDLARQVIEQQLAKKNTIAKIRAEGV